MFNSLYLRRICAGGLAAVAALALAACIVLPGKFATTLNLRKDGHFTYSYQGELVLLGLSRIAETMLKAKPAAAFEASTCFKDDEETERPCTTAELATQREDWDTAQAAAAKKRQSDLADFRRVFGGIDPTDPNAAAELTDRLSHQAGWKRVVYKGGGIFDVDVEITGMMDRDFAFPTIERMPGVLPFLAANRRNTAEVRIDSPLMQYAGLGSAGGAAMQVFAREKAGLGANGSNPWAEFPQTNGHFTLITDGVILSNNTEHGPKSVTGGKQLDWDINGTTLVAPMALIGLAK